ncbi:ROK family transcriptional regulator [Nocardioides perillae]|uniref:Putative NBD/HSP70 family sugar kinase n=1 Tax=Nocardioides perillae TaxID=1119534 RepID=A0A7Y9RNN5_9ACTN|nr:ROK family transcriptional regulator [Nocardioides perillae]NYG53721.1 putative NBD/HSP70 family sugar kinase [Nocardioides perillae]
MATPGELLELLRTGRASTRADLARATGLSRTAVNHRLDALLAAGLVRRSEELASTGGRPATGLAFADEAGVVLACALGRTRSQLAVCDLAGRELASSSREHALGVGPHELLPAVAAELTRLLGEAGRDPADVLGVGVSLPGAVDPVAGASLDSPVMRGWAGVPLGPALGAAAGGAPLFVAGDADALARSERTGRPDEPRDVLVVKASTGLALGIVAGGRVVGGHRGAAGELGHTRSPSAEGLPCRCGRTGCLEAVAGGWALVQRLAVAGREVAHVRDLVALALDGDAEARGLLREGGRLLGEVLAVAVDLLNPEVVVVGGDMAADFDTYAAGLRESLHARGTALATRDLRIAPARHGDRAGVVGCAALALDHVLHPAAVDARLAASAATVQR